MPDHPLAYFITIRTYGTWMSGDPRGSVDKLHDGYGEPFALRDDFRANYQRRHMKDSPFLISARDRSAIEAAIVELCAHRAWELHALNVRTNHVHVVVSAEKAPETVMGDIKAYATRALRRSGAVALGPAIWASHGSTRRAWDLEQFERWVAYTIDGQGDDLPGSAWTREKRNWIADQDQPTRP